MSEKPISTGEKVARRLLGFAALAGLGAVYLAAGLGAAPFDKGMTMRGIGASISRGGGTVLSDLYKWTTKK